jgi:hypothetical protein
MASLILIGLLIVLPAFGAQLGIDVSVVSWVLHVATAGHRCDRPLHPATLSGYLGFGAAQKRVACKVT